MTQYLLLIQENVKSSPTGEEWEAFFAKVFASGFFKGGSEVGDRVVLGDAQTAKSTDHIVGYMRFDTDDREALLALLEAHPVVVHGGSVELCELPRS